MEESVVTTKFALITKINPVVMNEYSVVTTAKAVLIAFSSKRQVHLITSPPTPLLTKERGDKAQLYWGEVKVYLTCLGKAI